MKNSISKDESRVILNYSKVLELLLETHLELSFKVHDNLSNSRHQCFLIANLKHVYLIINLHSDDRHYFIFIIFEIDQLQLTRMQQESKSTKFIMTELIYRAFEVLSFSIKKLFLLHSIDLNHQSMFTFYINDFFEDFKNFDEQYEFLRTHFLFWVEWAKLRLSFKKLKLFQTKIRVLDVIHHIDDKIRILKERVARIARWSTFVDAFEIRDFLSVVKIIKRWVRNFVELARSLTRLIDKVNWKWLLTKKLSFEILKIKCTAKISMHEIDLRLKVHFYIDVFEFEADLVITQFQFLDTIDINENKIVKILIIYDSFIFAITRRKYSIYKRELYVMIFFVTKYDYLCKHSYFSAIVHIDHKSLIHFLSSNLHEDIYDHWTNKLRRLNLTIQYISRSRNKIVDVLSRTLFTENECETNEVIQKINKSLQEHDSMWVWKDDKKEFDEFLVTLNSTRQTKIRQHDIMNDLSVFSLITIARIDVISWKQIYEIFTWFDEIYELLIDKSNTFSSWIIKKSFDYRIVNDILWIHHEKNYLSCILEARVLQIFQKTHDDSEHWEKTNTLIKLRDQCYWSSQTQNVERYIVECIDCARHDCVTRSQSLHLVLIIYLFQLIEMNFVDSLSSIKADCRYIFVMICYFFRFVVSFATKNNNVENVLWCLKLFFVMYRTSHAIYCDRDQHFLNDVLKEFLQSNDVIIDYSSSRFFKSIEMIEVSNKLLENVLQKNHFDLDWNARLAKSTKFVNDRIIDYLNMSSTTILFDDIQNISITTVILLDLFERNILD